jgi:ABC-type sugar transport system permease subunit
MQISKTRKAKKYVKRRNDMFAAYALLFPTLLLFIIFTAYPFFYAFYISLTRWDGFTEPIFIGLDNFRRMINDPIVWLALRNNMVFMVFTCFFKVLLGFIIAIFLRDKFRGSSFFRVIFFMPVIMSFVAVGLIWRFIFNPNFGLVNGFLFDLGITTPDDPILWLGSPILAMAILIFVDIWRWTGYHVVLFLAGLQTIPNELYEAAAIDGANERAKIRYITLPMMKGMTMMNLVFCMTGALAVFDLVMVMTLGGPYNSTQVIALYTFQIAFGVRSQFGYATSINIMLFFVILFITLVLTKIMNKDRD